MIEIKLTDSYRAEARGIVVDYTKRSRGSPICDLARKLVDAGHSINAMCYCTREEKLCIEPIRLGRLAGLSVRESDNNPRSAHFVKWTPFKGNKT